MKVTNPARETVEIEGTIRGMQDVAEIKSMIDAMRLEEGDPLYLTIRDSFSMPSALIGYLLKLAEQQKVTLHLTVGNAGLAELLADLNLTRIFNLRHKERAIA